MTLNNNTALLLHIFLAVFIGGAVVHVHHLQAESQQQQQQQQNAHRTLEERNGGVFDLPGVYSLLIGNRDIDFDPAVRSCVQAAYAYRFLYCDILRGRITFEEWDTQARNLLTEDIFTSGGGGAGFVEWNGIERFLDEDEGIIAFLKNQIIGDYKACSISYGDNMYVKERTRSSITLVMPNVKAASWEDSPVVPPFSPGGPGKFLEYEEDEYTCEGYAGDWKISQYIDPNFVLVIDTFSPPSV